MNHHLPAFVGALVAHPRTFLTMLVMVMFAIGGTSLADNHAKSANFGRKLRPATHEVGRRAAELRAVLVYANAPGQFRGIPLVRAGFAQRSHSSAHRRQALMHDSKMRVSI